MRYFAESYFSRSFGLIWQVVFKFRILSLTREIGYLFLLTYSFRKMFFIGQNLKYVHMTYSFLELLIFFLLTLLRFFFSPHQRNICVNTNFEETNLEIKTKRCAFSLVSDIDVENPVINVKLKFLINNFYTFLS